MLNLKIEQYVNLMTFVRMKFLTILHLRWDLAH